jgi:hypothetical protein
MSSGINYFINPRGETNTTGWSATNGTVSQDSANVQPGTGSQCIKVTATASGVVSVSLAAPGLTVGQRYATAVYCKVPTGVQIQPTAGGAAGYPTTLANDWTRARVSATAAATSLTVTWTTTASVPAGTVLYFHRALCTDGELPGPYFDGDSPNGAWSGTAHASQSSNSAFASWTPDNDTAILAGALCLNTLAWNISTKTGRMTVPAFRGANLLIPGISGKQYVPNKPLDTGLLTLSMWILGSNPDGTVPRHQSEQLRQFERNLTRLLQSVAKHHEVVTISEWGADGTVRTTSGELQGTSDISSMMAGARGEVSLVFDVIPGTWQDWLASTNAGVAGTHWSNDVLTMPLLTGGTSPIGDGVVTVYGPIANPRVETPQNGVWVQLNDTLANGDTWVVDSGAYTSKKNGVSNLGNVTHSNPTFMLIPPGELLAAPTLKLSGTGTGAATNMQLVARRKHLIGY